MCEEFFGGELDVTEKTPDPFESDKSQVRQYRDWLHEMNERQLDILKKVELALEKIDSFSRSKKNMHLPFRDGIQKTKKELGELRYDIEDIVCYLDSFEYLMRGLMVQKMKEVRPSKSKRGPHRTPANGRESRQRVQRCLRRRSRQRRGRKPQTKKRSEWRSLTGRTSERRRSKRRSSPERRRNLAVRAQKRCSLNQRKE